MPAIRLRPDGRYSTALTLHGHRYWVYGRTKAELGRQVQTLQAQATRGTLAPPTHLKVGDYLEWWLTSVTPSLKPSTLASYQTLVRRHLVPSLGHVKLERLTPAQLAWLYSQKRAQGLSPRRVQMLHRVLSKALKDAVRLETLVVSPCTKVRPPKVERRPPVIWDVAELDRFLAGQAQHPTRWSPLWTLLLSSTLRLGEATGLRWSDVDVPRGQLTVRQTLIEVHNQPQVGTPKTTSSRRTLALPALALEALAHQRQTQAAEQLAAVTWPCPGYVFLTRTGRHPSQSNLNKFFKASCRRAGVRPLHPHALRHLSASLLLRAGVDVKRVQQRLGHASLSTTLNIYAHVLDATDQDVAAELERSLRPG